MRQRRLLLLFTAGCGIAFLAVTKRLHDALGVENLSHAPTPPRGALVPVRLDAPLASSAASGLAAVSHGSTWLLAVANFYGSSSLYELDSTTRGLAPRLVQSFATKAAHDWEALSLPDGQVQLVAAEYDAARSLVFELNASSSPLTGSPAPRPLAGWPDCADTDAAACATWARAGECKRNPGFMHTSCAASCGQCAQLTGPLVAVAALPGEGGTAARHVRLCSRGHRAPAASTAASASAGAGAVAAASAADPAAAAASAAASTTYDAATANTAASDAAPHAAVAADCRDLLFVANYKARAGEGVAVYEWRADDHMPRERTRPSGERSWQSLLGSLPHVRAAPRPSRILAPQAPSHRALPRILAPQAAFAPMRVLSSSSAPQASFTPSPLPELWRRRLRRTESNPGSLAPQASDAPSPTPDPCAAGCVRAEPSTRTEPTEGMRRSCGVVAECCDVVAAHGSEREA
jgi:hypothetical protein